MKQIFIIFFYWLMLLGSIANAETQNIQIEVGGTMINVPSPAGFHEISDLSPETRKRAETMTPPQNRLIAVFVSEADLGRIMKGDAPEFGRYMFLQVFRDLENRNISRSQFQQLGTQIKQQQNTLSTKLKDKADSFIEGAADKLSKDSAISLSLKMGEIVPLGVFLEQSNAVSLAMLAKYQVSAEGEKLDYVVISGTSWVRVKQKVLYANVYSTYKSQDDLNWVRSKSREWVNSLLTFNNTSTKTSGSTYRSSSSSEIGDKVISKGIGGAIGGILIALLIGVFQGAKRLFKKRKDDV